MYATTTLEELASRDKVVGDLTASTVPSPYKGWTLRWTWSFDGAPPASVTVYLFAAAGRIWDLTFSSDAASAELERTDVQDDRVLVSRLAACMTSVGRSGRRVAST